jgi:transcriptional regulator with XRE-family HTH domain
MSENNLVSFSSNLNKYLKKSNLSLKEFAIKLEVPASTIHGWLNGVPPKNLIIIKKIASILGVSVDELCFGQPFYPKEEHSEFVIKFGESSYKIIFKKIEND